MTPFSLFENDSRFSRDNIILRKIQDAGHLPWVEKPDEIKKAFAELIALIQSSS